MPRLFVYGSLMKGEDNAHLMVGARFVGTFCTLPMFRLVDLGAYPGMVAGGNRSIVGELYEVPAGTMQQLDEFEEHPNLFVRSSVSVRDAGRSHASATTCEAYLLRPEWVQHASEVASGDWRKRTG